MLDTYIGEEGVKWRARVHRATRVEIVLLVIILVTAIVWMTTGFWPPYVVAHVLFWPTFIYAFYCIHRWGKASKAYFAAEFDRIDREFEDRMKEIRDSYRS